jgi:hypothetical protein
MVEFGPVAVPVSEIKTKYRNPMKLNELTMHWSFFGQSAAKRMIWLACMVTLGVVTGCNREPIQWEVDLALPLIDDVIEWSDLFSDTSLFTTDGTTAVFAFQESLSSWDIESLTQLPDTLVIEELSPDFVGGPFQVPPGSVLLDIEEDIVFQGIAQDFHYIRLESGSIEYEVESSTNGYVELNYGFPGVIIDGQPVNLNVLLPPSVSGVTQSESGIIDLSGAEIDLTGWDGNGINRIASDLMIGTPDFVTDTAQVFGEDSITVKMQFQDMLVRQVTGYFGAELLDIDVEESLFNPENFLEGFIDISPSRARLEFQNTIGADLRLTLDALSVDGIGFGHPALGVPQLISRANLQGDVIVPALWELDLMQIAPSFFEVLSYLPETINVLGSATLNPLGDVSGGNDFFDAQSPPELMLDLEWPLSTQIESLKLRQVRDIEPMSIPDFQGDLVVQVTNGFPISWGLEWVWTFENTALEPLLFAGESPAFQSSTDEEEAIEYRIPISSEMLLSGGQLEILGSMQSNGPVTFRGNERLRLQVRVEGTHQVEIE